MARPDSDAAHLRWLTKYRGKTQNASLKLFELIEKHDEVSNDPKYYSIAQELIAVAFSLWRAVFLADKSGDKGRSLEAAHRFLGTLLQDNAINYPQDRATRDWTFSYYTTNAWHHLVRLNRYLPNGLTYDFLPSKPKERWEYLQAAFDKAVVDFSKTLTKKKKQATSQK